MCSRRSHTPHRLAPLTNITSSKLKYKWTKIEQDAFYVITRILAHYTTLTYPDLNGEFQSYTIASAFQSGSVSSH